MIPIVESHHQIGWMVGQIRPPAVSVTFLVKGTYDLRPGGAATPAEEPEPLSGDLHFEDDPAHSLRYASDFALFKPRADVIVVGHCHAPGGKPSPVVRAGFAIGSYSKAIAVLGDRLARGSVLGLSRPDPEPFLRMPLRYENAWGGPGYAKNPIGKGFAEEVAPDGKKVRRMPNLENPENLVVDSQGKVDPWCPGPIPMTWTQRISRAGSYDKKWLQERWPNFPEDFDWRFFNAAPPDQQLPAYLQGDERLRFENLHPKHPEYESRLPGLRVRCLFGGPSGSRIRLREVPLNLDSLWIDVDAERLVLVWRGVAALVRPELAEDDHVMIASESLANPPTPVEAFEQRLNPPVALLPEEAPPPPEVNTPPKSPAPPPEVEPPPSPEELELDRALSGLTTRLAERQKAAPPLPAPPPESPEVVEAEIPPPPPPPPAPPPRTRELRPNADLTGIDLSGMDLHEIDLQGSVLAGAKLVGTNLTEANLTNAVLEKADLTDARLTRAVLTNADLTSARLPRADLSGSSLAGAVLSEAILARANMNAVQATGALLGSANLCGADLRGAVLEEALLVDCLLHDANLTEAHLAGANLERAWGCRLKAERADFTEVRAAGSNFGDASFRGIRAPGSIWEKAHLYRADFREADLAGAEMEAAFLVEARLSQANLKRARLVRARLRGAELLRTNLFRADFEHADLTGADCSESNLFEAGFLDTVTEGTRFQSANLKRTILAK